VRADGAEEGKGKEVLRSVDEVGGSKKLDDNEE